MIFLGGEGITVGAHRLWTHRSYKARMPLQILLIVLQTLAGQVSFEIFKTKISEHRLPPKHYISNSAPSHRIPSNIIFFNSNFHKDLNIKRSHIHNLTKMN